MSFQWKIYSKSISRSKLKTEIMARCKGTLNCLRWVKVSQSREILAKYARMCRYGDNYSQVLWRNHKEADCYRTIVPGLYPWLGRFVPWKFPFIWIISTHTWGLGWGHIFSRQPFWAPEAGIDALTMNVLGSLITLFSKDSSQDAACKLSVRECYPILHGITWAWHSSGYYAKCSVNISWINELTTSLFPSWPFLTIVCLCQSQS